MKKRILIAIVLAMFFVTSMHAQTKDFFELVKTGTPQDVQAAIEKGANLNGRSSTGSTPLIIAAAYNTNPEVILLPLKVGADAKAKDNVGQTVIDYAQGNEKLKGTDAYRQLEKASQ